MNKWITTLITISLIYSTSFGQENCAENVKNQTHLSKLALHSYEKGSSENIENLTQLDKGILLKCSKLSQNDIDIFYSHWNHLSYFNNGIITYENIIYHVHSIKQLYNYSKIHSKEEIMKIIRSKVVNHKDWDADKLLLTKYHLRLDYGFDVFDKFEKLAFSDENKGKTYQEILVLLAKNQ